MTQNNRHHYNTAPAFPKEHRDLLLHPYGRLVSSSAEPSGNRLSSLSPPSDGSARSVPAEAQLEEIRRFLSNPAEILQHLLSLLREPTPPSDFVHSDYPPLHSSSSGFPLSSDDSHTSSSWVRYSHSQP